MHVKTMEGLISARTNINTANVPMRVYKEAERKGDTATMERAMGYVNDFENRAYEYKARADEGMEEEAKENKEKEKLEREQELEQRREERKQEQAQLQKQIQENQTPVQSSPEAAVQPKNDNINNLQAAGTDKNTQDNIESFQKPVADTVEISPDGHALLSRSNDVGTSMAPGAQPGQPVFYSSAGAVKRMSQSDTPTLNVSV